MPRQGSSLGATNRLVRMVVAEGTEVG